MVTINPDKSVMNIAEAKKMENREEKGSVKFGSVFKELITSDGAAPAASEATMYLTDIRPAQFSESSPSVGTKIVDRFQALIDTMDTYQQKLSQADTTLRQIEPFVDKMAAQATTLEELTEATSQDDELKTIINQALTLSAMEIAKYRSGQYNDE